MEIEIAILAGGGSIRAGIDKANIVWRGLTVLERIANEALLTTCPVVVVGRERPQEWTLPSVRFVPDDVPGSGPLGGLSTALTSSSCDAVVLLACDMPLLTVRSIVWLTERAAELVPFGAGVVVRNGGLLEPLFSVYSQSCKAQVVERLNRGSRAMHKFIEGGAFTFVDVPTEIEVELANFNTREEWNTLLDFGSI